MSFSANVAEKPLCEDQCAPLTPERGAAVNLDSLTRNEQFVYRELKQSDGPQKAYALLETLNDEGLRAPMTIYRALDGLIAKGLAKKITSQNAYIAVHPEAQSAVVAYVTCKRCGKTHEISLKKSAIAEIFRTTSLRLDEIFIEAYGECGDMQEAV